MAASSFDQAVEQYHLSVDEFVKGNPEPQKKLYSQKDDVSLANPLGPTALGWEQVAERMERTSSQFRDGEAKGFENIVTYVTPELAFIVEIERATVKVGASQDIVSVALRVTTIFRPEDGTWKIVHRHADPITSARPIESIVQK